MGVFLGRGGLTAGFLEKDAVVTAEDGRHDAYDVIEMMIMSVIFSV